MATQRPRFTSVMSPKGIFVWPRLNEPDTKFNKDGAFSVRLRLSPENSQILIDKIEAELAAFWPKAKEELQEKLNNAKSGADKAKARKALEEMKESDKAYKPAYDDDGNETGEFEFNFKMPATYVKDKGKATEKVVSIRPDIFDAKGRLLRSPPPIWGGSEGYVSGELRPFSTTIGVGVSLRLKAAQVTKLVSGSGGRDAAAYGFGAEDGGYEAPEEAPEQPAAGDTEAGGDADDSGPQDF